MLIHIGREVSLHYFLGYQNSIITIEPHQEQDIRSIFNNYFYNGLGNYRICLYYKDGRTVTWSNFPKNENNIRLSYHDRLNKELSNRRLMHDPNDVRCTLSTEW